MSDGRKPGADAAIFAQLERSLGVRPLRLSALGGGCVSDVSLVEMPGGERFVAKSHPARCAGLDAEGRLLRWLAARTSLPLPRVIHADDALLVLEFVEGTSEFSPAAERHAAECLAALHENTSDLFGFDFDTPVGGLMQPNGRSGAWVEFFRDRRILHLAAESRRAGRIGDPILERLRRAADRLGEWIEEPERPSLIHGDVWTGNVLAQRGRIRAFLDPAACFAHSEQELAFITLFSTFGEAFFDRYQDIRPIRAGFFERRRHAYNLYPMLVHVRLFGGAYVRNLEGLLARLGV